MTYLLSFLLELLDGSLVNTTALVDEMAGGGRLARVDVTDDDDVDVGLFFSHCWLVGSGEEEEERLARKAKVARGASAVERISAAMIEREGSAASANGNGRWGRCV